MIMSLKGEVRMNDYRQHLLKQIGITKSVSEIRLLEWCRISEHNVLSEEFIREFQGKLSWGAISEFQKLSEGFIREYKDKMFWYNVSKHQKLSEDFIREFQPTIRWVAVSEFQNLTDDFIIEFQDKILWDIYFQSQKASFNIMKKFLLKSNMKELVHFKSSHLTVEQKQAIEKMLKLKYMFAK